MKEMDKFYKKVLDVEAREIADEVILVPIRGNIADMERAFTMNQIGGFIWKHIDGKRAVSEIKEAVSNEFSVSPEKAEKDLIYFISQLKSLDLINQV